MLMNRAAFITFSTAEEPVGQDDLREDRYFK